MPSFVADRTEHRARSKQLRQTGTLTLRTRIDVGDGYHTGLVPVRVAYEASFCPDAEFWEHAEDDPSERYPVYYTKGFDSADEREFHCRTFYEFLEHAAA